MANGGALTKEDFLAIWISATDKSYHQPFLDAGEGEGLEVHTQMMEQFARASEAIDVTTQAMYIRPWSGQTNPSAGGARNARVQLTFRRTKLYEKLLILKAGQIFVSEEAVDAGEFGGEAFLTGRRYVLEEDAVFLPGFSGDVVVWAVAERAGYGYNNPFPGTIKSIDQPGDRLANDHASIFVDPSPPPMSTANGLLVATNVPDMFVPDNVGQYVYLTSGVNAGRIGRVYEFINPDLTQPIQLAGSRVKLAWEYAVEGVQTGTFISGEPLSFTFPGGAIQIATGLAPSGNAILAFSLLDADPSLIAVGNVITGTQSGATFTVSSVLFDGGFTQDVSPVLGSGGLTWRLLNWVDDWGLTCTNVERPTLGRAPFLDALGWERGIRRAPGEDDSSYVNRIIDVGDVVSPNAIKRAIAKTMGSIPWCFKEVGTNKFPGFFFDGDNSPASATPHGAANDAYDTTVLKVEVSPMSAGSIDALAKLNNPMRILDADGNLVLKGWFGRVDLLTNIVRMITTHKVRPGVLLPLTVEILYDYAPTFSSHTVVSTSVPPSWDSKKDHVWLDYEQFRGFFEVCTPPLGYGDSGQAYDAGPHNAYDAAPFNFFYDGQPWGNAFVYKRLRQAIDEVRAGGVAFDLCVDDTCTKPNG